MYRVYCNGRLCHTYTSLEEACRYAQGRTAYGVERRGNACDSCLIVGNGIRLRVRAGK